MFLTVKYIKMNCQLCQQEFDSYNDGKLSDDMRKQIDLHLITCSECKEFYRLQMLAERIIAEEKELLVNPFLSARVIAELGNRESGIIRTFTHVWRPALIGISMAAAVFLGIIMGSIPQYNREHETIPVELALIDDVRLESLDLLSNE